MNLKKFISGISALTIAASAFAGMAVTASAAGVTLGPEDNINTGNWWELYNSTKITIASGEEAVFEFTNHTGKQNNWDGWLARVSNENGTSEYINLRQDHFIWGDKASSSSIDKDYTFGDDPDTDMINFMDGSHVKVTFTHNNSNVVIRADISKGDTSYHETCTISDITENVVAWMSVDNAHLTDLIYAKQNIGSTQLYERGSINSWTSADVGTGEWVASNENSVTATTTDGLKVASASGNRSATYTLSPAPTANSILKLDAEFFTGGSTGNTGIYTYFEFGDSISVRAYGQDQKGVVVLGGKEYSISNACGNSNGNRGDDTWTISIAIDTSVNTITSMSINGLKGNNKASFNASNVVLPGTAVFDSFKVGHVRISRGTPGNAAVKSVSLTETTQDVTSANYTVNYLLNGTTDTVRTSAVRKGHVSDNITLLSTDTEDFKNSDATKKYIYVSDTITSDGNVAITADGSASVNVYFREAPTWSYTVKSSVGDFSKSGTLFEGDTATTAYPAYVNVGGTLYTRGTTDRSYNDTYKPTGNNKTKTLNYTETDINNVVYYSEGEDIDGFSSRSTGNIGVRASQSAVGYLPSNNDTVTVTTLPAGTYRIFGQMATPNSATKYTLSLGTNTTDVSGEKNVNTTSFGGTATKPEITWTIDGSTPLTITRKSGDDGLDYIYVVKVADDEASATATWIKDYDRTALDDSTASVWSFTVTAGSTAISDLGLKLGENAATTSVEMPTISAGSTVCFGAVINKLASELTGMSVYDGEDTISTIIDTTTFAE